MATPTTGNVLSLEVAAPKGLMLSTQATSVQAPGTAGEFGVLPGHLPILAGIRPGVLKYVTGGKSHVAAVGRGYFEGGPDRALLLVDAARKADAEAEGSYAAAYADPLGTGVVAVKSGSSLYAGAGSDDSGRFVVVSSDLTSVLSKTRMLVPLSEGQGIWFDESSYVVFSLGPVLSFSAPRAKRSKLNVRDTELRAPFEYFMDQEIASSPENLDEVARYYFRSPRTEGLFAAFEDRVDLCKAIVEKLLGLYGAADEAAL